jgi:L-lactate dehydrogenase complex protein LldG
LAAELEALGAKYHACSPSESSLFVLNILREKEIHEILAWDPAFLPEGMLETIAREGIRVFHPDGESLENDSQIRAGITGAAAIAETGSLLVLGGAGRPLGVSLLPEIHIAVIRSKDILETVSEALQVEGIRQASASVIITGPSRTADIEMTLTIGVHGPGELHVICVQED